MTIKSITFPEHLSTGTRLGPGYRTTIVQTASGAEYRNAQISKPLHRYDVRKAVQTAADVADLLDFYHQCEGSLYGFRFWDPYDHSTASDHTGTPATGNATLGTGDGTNRFFQLVKVYSYGGSTKMRTITQPKVDTTVVALDGVAQTAGADFTVDTATGVVAFTTPPGAGRLVTGGCEFYVPCRFGRETDRWLAINGDQQIANLSQIVVEEIGDTLPVFEMGRTGGAAPQLVVATGSVTLTASSGLVQRFQCNEALPQNCWLPSKDTVPLGGPIFVVENVSASTRNIVLADSDTTAGVSPVTAGSVVEVYLGTDSSGNREWVALT